MCVPLTFQVQLAEAEQWKSEYEALEKEMEEAEAEAADVRHNLQQVPNLSCIQHSAL
eukprot:COSAG05_NODE_1682_length_4285_cov_33.861682_7_plen_57_part_00